MTPTEIRATYPAHVLEAWDWIEIYAPHYATQGRDWQTTDNMSAEDKATARRHIATLRDAGMLEIESAPPRGNFVKGGLVMREIQIGDKVVMVESRLCGLSKRDRALWSNRIGTVIDKPDWTGYDRYEGYTYEHWVKWERKCGRGKIYRRKESTEFLTHATEQQVNEWLK